MSSIGRPDADAPYFRGVRFASHIFAMCSPTMMMPPVARVFSRNPSAIGVLAAGIGVAFLYLGSAILGRFIHLSH
jgi:hypothetical protein